MLPECFNTLKNPLLLLKRIACLIWMRMEMGRENAEMVIVKGGLAKKLTSMIFANQENASQRSAKLMGIFSVVSEAGLLIMILRNTINI